MARSLATEKAPTKRGAVPKGEGRQAAGKTAAKRQTASTAGKRAAKPKGKGRMK